MARHSNFHSRLKCSLLLLGIVLLCTVPRSLNGQVDPEKQTLDRMVRLGLTQAASDYTRSQAELWAADPVAFARWRKREMEVYAQQALREQDSASRQAAWQASENVYQQFLQQHPENPRLPWLAFQYSRNDLLRAQSELAIYLAAPANTTAREEALTLVRKILRDCETLKGDVQLRQPIAAREGLRDRTQAPAKELAELNVDTSLLECEALLVRGKLYDRGSTDRTAAATEVDRRATEVLTRAGEEWASVDALKVAKASAMLELGVADQGLQLLAELTRNASNSTVRRRAALAAAEHLLEVNQLSRARQAIRVAQTLQADHPAVVLVQLQLELAELDGLGKAAKEQKLAEMLERAKTMGDLYGGYWRNRAEALLTGAGAAASSTSADLMTVEIRQLLAAGDETQAIKKLLEFGKNEIAAGNANNAIQLSEQAVALLISKQDWSRALAAANDAAFAFPEHSAAAKLNLQGLFALTQILRSDPSETNKSTYEQSLLSHLERWPQGEEAEVAQGWLRAWLLGNRKRTEYLSALLRRAEQTTTTEGQRQILETWLHETLDSSASQRVAALQEIRDQLTSAQFENRRVFEITELLATGFHEWPSPELGQEIDARVQKHLRSVALDDPSVGMLQALQMLRFAQQSDSQNAGVLGRKWNAQGLPNSLRQSFARSFVEAIDESRQGFTAWGSLARLDSGMAELLVSSSSLEQQAAGLRIQYWQGDEQGLKGLRALSQRNPRDGVLLLQLANALATKQDGLSESTSIVRRLAASSKPGSDLNFAARWRMMKNLRKSGESDKAKQSAELFLASQPIADELWLGRFKSLTE